MAFNSYRKTVLCIYFRSIFIFFFFLSPSRVEVKQNIRFPFLPGSPVYLRIQSTNMKPVTQIEQASAHVVVLSLGIQSPVALPQGDLPGFIYQQRADLLPPGTPDTPSGHTGTDIERTPAAARPAQRIFRPHRRPENTVLHFVIVVVFIGKAHSPYLFRRERPHLVAPPFVYVREHDPAGQGKRLVGQANILPVFLVDNSNANHIFPSFHSTEQALFFCAFCFRRWAAFFLLIRKTNLPAHQSGAPGGKIHCTLLNESKTALSPRDFRRDRAGWRDGCSSRPRCPDT